MRTKQQQIIHELGVMPTIDPAQEFERRSQFMCDYLATCGMKGFVLGISGGQDSMLAGLIAKKAVELRRESGHEAEFHALLLPYGQQQDRADALAAIDYIQPDRVHDLNIKSSTDAFCSEYMHATSEPLADFHKGNVKARMRMIAHYAIAGSYGLLVIGTDHAAEAVTGFYTKFGDGGADVLPLSGLTKRQGRQLLTYLHSPELFITKPPTADLLDTNPGQPDEFELGMDYESIDSYLEGHVIDPAAAAAIEKRFDMTAHKRTMPVAITPEM